MKILITGAAGYIGKFLASEMAQEDSAQILAIDKKEKPVDLSSKVNYLQADLSLSGWEERMPWIPDIIIHSAFDIRPKWKNIQAQEKNNIECCNRVFEYSFKNNISKVIYFGSAASYGARPENIGRLLTEDDPLTEKEYPYGSQKRQTEENLRKISANYGNAQTQAFVLRFSTVNGPEGEKRRGPSMLSMMKRFLPVIPYCSEYWARQYLHEQDILSAVQFLINTGIQGRLEVFNLTTNDFLTIHDVARLQKTIALKLPLWFFKLGLTLAWHLTFGYIATCPGSWRAFAYPSNLDGSKITKLGFKYKYNSTQTFLAK